MDRTACMQKADVPALHKAIGQAMLEDPAEKRHGVEVASAWACTAGLTGGDGDGAVLEAHDAAVGDSYFKDIRGEVFAGRLAVGIGLAVDVPGESPDLRIDVVEAGMVLHLVFEDGAVDGRKRFHRDKEVGS